MAMNSMGSLYTDYGGASRYDSVFGMEKGRQGAAFHARSVAMLTLPPWLMYAFMDIVFTTMAGLLFPLACLFAAICIAFSSLFAWVHKSNVKGPIYLYLSVLCFFGTINGIIGGLSIHARLFAPYYNYKKRPTYTDVLPTDPAAARADGAVIGFSSNAVVDTMRIGNMLSIDGKRFCAAPILDESQQASAEFWAVGVDCCIGHVSFHCDDAQNMQVKSGAVFFDIDSWFASPHYAQYQEAVKQAAGRYGLKIPKKPVLVRWMSNPNSIADRLWWDGTLHLFLGILFYFLVSAAVATVLHMCSTPR